ncbi:MAG: acireductone synthase [Myxococcota bacterium]
MRLLDIEGTVCPVTFVHDVLFPYARSRLSAFVRANRDDPEVAAALQAAMAEAGVGEGEVVATLERWIDEDRKVTALKVIQGRLWRSGYAEGALRAPLYDDVVPALDRWAAGGERIAVYSSGSVEAQQLLFGHTSAGDLRGRFSAWFDTRVGSKREAASYREIARACGEPGEQIRFYSDLRPEIDAAAEAGLQTRWIVRDGQLPAGASRDLGA